MDTSPPHSALLVTARCSVFAVGGLTFDTKAAGLVFVGSRNDFSPSVWPLGMKVATSTVHTSRPSQEFRERTKVTLGR